MSWLPSDYPTSGKTYYMLDYVMPFTSGSSETEIIYDEAFDACKVLKKIYIPNSVTEIRRDAIPDNSELVLYVYEGSYAESFAKKYDYDYEYYEPA